MKKLTVKEDEQESEPVDRKHKKSSNNKKSFEDESFD
jgi:hypothetical protein